MRVKFLFWNIRKAQGRLLTECLARLAGSGIDVFMFAEAPADYESVMEALNRNQSGQYTSVPAQSLRVRFFSRQNGPLAGAVWRDRFFDSINDRITALECQLSGALSFLVVGAHLDSPYPGLSADGRAEWARDVANDIKTIDRGCRAHANYTYW